MAILCGSIWPLLVNRSSHLVLSSPANHLQNNHEQGDLWNGEDLSIFSLDDTPLPISSKADSNGQKSANESTFSVDKTAPTFSSSRSFGQSSISPLNIKGALSTPPISPVPSNTPADLASKPGFRAAEAFVRPSPFATAGKVKSHGFDLRNATFTLSLTCDSAATEAAPTEIFLPEVHFPREDSVVQVSSGKWTITVEDDAEGHRIQTLRWWHGEGPQDLSVRGVRTRQGMPLGKEEETEGYFATCQQSQCRIM